jgi:hypothetical protein
MSLGGKLADAVFDVALVASVRLRKARELFAPAHVALVQLEKRRFDVFDSRLSRGVLGVSLLMGNFKLQTIKSGLARMAQQILNLFGPFLFHLVDAIEKPFLGVISNFKIIIDLAV